MNTKDTLFALAIMAAASVGVAPALAGHPVWPPPKHSAEYRQANMLFLRFQDALAAERWQEALSLCSDRVRTKASEWPSPGDFFNDTVPIDLLLSNDFGYWSGSSNFYGLLVPLTQRESKPLIQWYWAISATNQAWVVDYPPVRLEEYIARKKAAIQESESKAKQIRESLQPKLKAVKARLVPLSEHFIIGSPMQFRVDLVNTGQTTVDYMDSGVAYSPLTVLDAKGQVLPCAQTPAQVMVRKGKVTPGASVVVADRMDLNAHYAITKPGKYVVQFGGAELAIGQPVRDWNPGPFGEGENEVTGVFGFIGLTNRLPSDPIKIEVVVGHKP
jgi:hypothetical protein